MGVHPDAQETRAHQLRGRELNDQFRSTLSGGQVFLTSGIAALGAFEVARIMQAVQDFSDFTPDNDPHGEHDFGAIKWGLHLIFWKIDYYDVELEWGSPDPADEALTLRVLTVMLGSEY